MKDTMEITVESPALPPGEAYLIELDGREAISQLFRFSCQVASSSVAGLDTEALLTSPVTLVFTLGQVEQRRVHGIVSKVTEVFTSSKGRRVYRFELVPRLFRGSLNNKIDIYMNQSVPEIVATKLEALGLVAGEDFELRLGAYPQREFVVQYRESDVQFINRLTEHLGIAYYFEHDGGRDKVVFGDQNSMFRPIEGESSHVELDQRDVDRGVHTLETTTSTVVGRYLVRDYNYRTPQQDLTAIQGVTTGGAGDIVEYGAHFKTTDEGAELARIRAEEILAGRKVHVGQGVESRLRAGSTFVLEGHPAGDLDLLVTDVSHRARQNADGAVKDTANRYENEFRAIERATTYRPPRVTPKPKVAGVLTGIIDAAAKGQYAELDAEGRYRVKFLCDTAETPGGQASRPVRMAQPHAGQGYGMHFPLRPGIEVVVTCVDGAPDRPIIAGTGPNPATPTPVTAGNAPRNVIRTGGGNEINIDDTEGSQRIKMTTPHSSTVFQLGAPNEAERGAILTTESNITTIAAQGTTVLTNLNNGMGGLKTWLSGGNIVTEASVFKWAFDSVMAMIDAGLGMASGVAGVAMGYNTQVQSGAAADATAAGKAYGAATEGLTTAEKEAVGQWTKASAEREAAKKVADQKDARVTELEHERDDINASPHLQPLLSIDPNARETDEEREARIKPLREAKQREIDDAKKQAEAAHEKEKQATTAVADADKQCAKVDPKKRADIDKAAKAKATADAAKEAADEVMESGDWKFLQTQLAAVSAASSAAQAGVKAVKLVKELWELKSKAQDAKAIAGALAAHVKIIKVAAFSRTKATPSPPTTVVHTLSSTNTTMVHGLRHAYVTSRHFVGIHGGKEVAVLGNQKAIVSSNGKAELNGEKQALISSEKFVDVYSHGKIVICAHDAEQGIRKGSDDLYLVSKHDWHAASTDENVVIEAKKSITVDAQTEKLHAKAKKSIFLESELFGVKVDGEAKKLEIGKHAAAKDHGAVFDEKTIAMKNENMHLTATEETKITSKSLLMQTSEDLSITVKGDFKINGKKVTKIAGKKVEIC